MEDTARYRLVRTIATGGMAQVYEAVAVGERGFERRVAIKRVLPEHVHDEAMRRMFLDEARIASHLHHGGIVQVLDYGVIDGTEFIAMEYVDGIDALRASKKGSRAGTPISEALAMYVVAEVARALEHAHSRTDDNGEPLEIVHRDVSPQNILLSWDGDVKLSDFGIAVATQREERTATGIVKGKLHYMPPEQALGKAVTPAADVYALGATLHAMLAGAVPSNAFTRREGEPLEIDDELSEDVTEVVRAAMEWKIEDRPQTRAFAFRCGQLAARLMDRDARGALSEWLRGLKSEASRKANALDDLMGLALVAAGDGTYTVSRSDPDAENVALLPTEAAGGVTKPRPSEVPTEISGRHDRSSEPVQLPTRSHRWIVPVAGLFAVATTVAIVIASSSEGTDSEPPVADVTPIAAPEGEAQQVGAPDPEETSETVPDEVTAPEEPGVVPEVAEPPETRPLTTVSTMRPERSQPQAPSPEQTHERAPATEAEEATPAAPGYVRVPRASATAQEQIEVDGAGRGFTPSVLRLSPGSHRFVIRDASTGEVVTQREVTVEPHHTRTSPLVLPR